MASNEVKPADARHGPDQRLPHPHNQPGRAAHHSTAPHRHVTPPERTRLLEVPLDETQSLKTGLELLKRKVAEEAAAPGTKEETTKIYEQFRRAHDRNEEVFGTAFQRLRNERAGLSGTDFYDHIYRGLELLCLHNPEISSLAPAGRIAALLFPPEGRAAPSLENIVRIFRVGETSIRGHALRPGAATFLDIYLALRWGQKRDVAALTEQLASNRDLNCFLLASELLIGLSDRMEARIEHEANRKRVARDTAIQRLAEKKAEAELKEKLRALAAEERLAEERAGLSIKNAPLVKLGRAVLKAQADLGDLVFGLDRSGSPGEFLDKSLPLTEAETVMLLTRAWRWGQLTGQLAGMPAELADNITGLLADEYLSDQKMTEMTGQLAEPRQRALIELGFSYLRDDPKRLAVCFETDHPLKRLAAYGEFGQAFQQALASQDIASLTQAVLLCVGIPEACQLPGELSDNAKQNMIKRFLQTAGPQDIPALIKAGDLALTRFPRREREVRAEIALFVAQTIKPLCCSPEAIAQLLHDAPPITSAEPDLVELHPLPEHSPKMIKQYILSYLVKSPPQPPADDAAESEPAPAWAYRFGAEIRQLVVENRWFALRPGSQRIIISLAARLASVRESLENDKPVEARTELTRALAKAVKNDLKVPRVMVLIGLVYAGVLEKVLAGELKDLPALLGDPESPGLSVSAANVSAVLAGEIHTALGNMPGVSDDLVAEELLLHGLITRRVEYQREAVTAIISLLKDRRYWNNLLLMARQQPADAINFIELLLQSARAISRSNSADGLLRIVRPFHHVKVLHEALTKLES